MTHCDPEEMIQSQIQPQRLHRYITNSGIREPKHVVDEERDARDVLCAEGVVECCPREDVGGV